MTDGFEVFVQLVIAAITTQPSASGNLSPSISTSTECSCSATAVIGSASTRSGGSASVTSGALAGDDPPLPSPLRIGLPSLSARAGLNASAALVHRKRTFGRLGP